MSYCGGHLEFFIILITKKCLKFTCPVDIPLILNNNLNFKLDIFNTVTTKIYFNLYHGKLNIQCFFSSSNPWVLNYTTPSVYTMSHESIIMKQKIKLCEIWWWICLLLSLNHLKYIESKYWQIKPMVFNYNKSCFMILVKNVMVENCTIIVKIKRYICIFNFFLFIPKIKMIYLSISFKMKLTREKD